MDETSKPKGPFEVDPIGEEVQEQLRQARQRAASSSESNGSDDEITSLPGDTTEYVEFNPSNQTMLPDHVAEIQGHRVIVHSINSMPNILMTILDFPAKTRRTEEALTAFRATYEPVVKETQFKQLAYILNQNYPKLFARLKEIIEAKVAALDDRNQAMEKFGPGSPQFEAAKQAEFLPKEQHEYNMYFFSKTYDALSVIVRGQNLAVDLKQLT